MAWVPIPDLGQGLNKDGQDQELALGVCSDSRNMRFRAGFAERCGGMATVFTTPLVAPYHILQYEVGTTRFVVYAGLQKTYADDGVGTQTDITNANNTGAIGDRWCGNVFNGIYVQNNGVDVPQYWDGNVANKLANLTAWPAGYKAGFLRPFKNYLVAGDVTRGGVRERGTVLWSHLADPGTIPTSWDITDPTKDAGDQSLSETNGTLIDSLPLGDMNVIYKDDSLYFQQTIQSSAIFRFGRLPGDVGLLARGCVVNIPIGHVFLTAGLDVVIHTGQGLQSVIEGKMRKWLASNINPSQTSRSFLVSHPATNEVLICFPDGANTDCTKAIAWNWKDNTFGIRDLSAVTYGSTGIVNITGTSDTWGAASGTWATDSTAWGDVPSVSAAPRLIFARSTPTLALYESTEQDNGVSFTASAEWTGLHFDAPDKMKLLRAARPKINAAAGTVVQVQFGASMTADTYPTWQNPVSYTVGTDNAAYSFAQGLYLAVRMYTSGDTPWRVRSCTLDIVETGSY